MPVRRSLRDAVGKMQSLGLSEAIFAIPSMPEQERSSVLRRLSENGIHIMMLPGTLEMIGRMDLPSQLREVQIDDLLGRDEVHLDPAPVDALIAGRTVLVTGGGGSIGSELCRQIARHRPKKLVVFDIYENNAYDIQQELKFQYGNDLDLAVEIGSVRDADRLMRLMAAYRGPRSCSTPPRTSTFRSWSTARRRPCATTSSAHSTLSAPRTPTA